MTGLCQGQNAFESRTLAAAGGLNDLSQFDAFLQRLSDSLGDQLSLPGDLDSLISLAILDPPVTPLLCVEREVQHKGRHFPTPLLYTSTPELGSQGHEGSPDIPRYTR